MSLVRDGACCYASLHFVASQGKSRQLCKSKFLPRLKPSQTSRVRRVPQILIVDWLNIKCFLKLRISKAFVNHDREEQVCSDIPFPLPSSSKFIIVSMVTDHLTDKLGLGPILSVSVKEMVTDTETETIRVNRP